MNVDDDERVVAIEAFAEAEEGTVPPPPLETSDTSDTNDTNGTTHDGTNGVAE